MPCCRLIHIFLDGNTATGNGLNGIDLEELSGTQVTRNTATQNANVGIKFHDHAVHTFCWGNTVTRTTNSSRGNGNGIECDNADGAVIDHNTCTGNAVWGIYAVNSDSTTTTLSGNTQ